LVARAPTPPLFPYTTLFRSCAPAPAARSAYLRTRICTTAIRQTSATPCLGLNLHGILRLDRNGTQAGASLANLLSSIAGTVTTRSEEHTSELQSLAYLVCRL